MFKGPHKPAVIQTHPLPCSPCYLFSPGSHGLSLFVLLDLWSIEV